MALASLSTMMDHITKVNGGRIRCMEKGSCIIQVRRLLTMAVFMKMIFMEKGDFITRLRVWKKWRLILKT